ncbi:MAG: cytochrome C [Geobacter sp.]|nr:MAG: cytochrome C [Geobacter sp.]
MRKNILHTSAVRLAVLLAATTVVAACATGAIRERILTLPVIEGATYVGDKDCAQCHEKIVEPFADTIHGKLADFEVMGGTKGCESCHGAGSIHAAAGDTAQILSFSSISPDQASAICLKCHSAGTHMEWAGNEHALNDVTCTDCHKIHQSKKAKHSLKLPQPDLCYSCHQEYRAKAEFPSHHPIREGKMTCTSCHQPHGTGQKSLKTEERANDLCLTCHSRYQGPFVFEHAPVQEDCTICHDAHGSVANNLLKQNEPFLCLQCHESHFHTIRTGATIAPGNVAYDANTNPSGALSATNSVQFESSHGAEGWAKAFGTKCTVCHSQVHGSDLPSQTAPSVNTDGSRGWPDGAKGLTR